jgi:hypothetical protein
MNRKKTRLEEQQYIGAPDEEEALRDYPALTVDQIRKEKERIAELRERFDRLWLRGDPSRRITPRKIP